MDSNKQRAGQLGGITTLTRYGTGHLSEIGKQGGRPSLPSLEEFRQHTTPEAPNNGKRRERTPNALKELKELWLYQVSRRPGASTGHQVRDDGLDGAPGLLVYRGAEL